MISRPETARQTITAILCCALLWLSAGCRVMRSNDVNGYIAPRELDTLDWEHIQTRARGTTVVFAMWAGDEARNRFFRERVVAEIKQKFDITLRITPLGDTEEIINKLVNEKEANRKAAGSVDLIWINGENFRTAKRGDLLWGPFADRLPNIAYYPLEARARDFGTPIENYEAPWQRSQFVIAYDTARVGQPPQTIEDLRAYVMAHPGRFTYIAPPDFTGSVFIRHLLYHFGGGAQKFQHGYDESLYQHAAAQTIDFLNEIKPYLWRRGETYPVTPKDQDRLFANGEIDFSMSYGPSFASERIARGEYPPSARTFVFADGTIGNYNFLAIPFNSDNAAGSLVVINELMSPRFQLEQSRALGSVFPLALERLTPQERAAAEELPRGPATLSAAELDAHLIPEADAQYVEQLEKDWQAKVLRGESNSK